ALTCPAPSGAPTRMTSAALPASPT
ncbi:uncharacterized protein METZ01_LOCUS145874, partial [marine metagenome]